MNNVQTKHNTANLRNGEVNENERQSVSEEIVDVPWYCGKEHQPDGLSGDNGQKPLSDISGDEPQAGDLSDSYGDGQETPEDLRFCDRCGEGYPEYELSCIETRGGTENYCQSCLDRHCFWCNDCERYYTDDDDYISYRGNRVCRSCADANYHYCERCESYVYCDDYNYDRERCYNCADNDNTGVEDYHENDYWEHIGECKPCWKGKWRGLGIELEIDRSSENKGAERNTVEAVRYIYDNLKFEYDSSLDNGFEIITQPHTVTEFYKIDWERILQACKDNGYVSEQNGTCGLHYAKRHVMLS